MTDVERQVVGFIAAKFGIKEEDIALEAPIFGIMGADSLDAVELLIGLEDEFGVEIPDEVAMQLRTVQDVIDCLAMASAGKQQTQPRFPPAPKPL